MTALYLERYMNYGITPRGTAGRQADHRHRPDRQRPVAVQPPSHRTGERVRDGIRDAGGIALEFPMHPIQETGKRPTAALDRNLAYLAWSKCCTAIPLDGVVLTTGCDKTTPACLMGAATVNIPPSCCRRPDAGRLVAGPRTGSGTIVWEGRKLYAEGEIDYEEFMKHGGLVGAVGRPLQHHGHRDHR
jgi:dihydroxy-acid dehydratase